MRLIHMVVQVQSQPEMHMSKSQSPAMMLVAALPQRCCARSMKTRPRCVGTCSRPGRPGWWSCMGARSCKGTTGRWPAQCSVRPVGVSCSGKAAGQPSDAAGAMVGPMWQSSSQGRRFHHESTDRHNEIEYKCRLQRHALLQHAFTCAVASHC